MQTDNHPILPPIAVRNGRIQQAVALSAPDCVPFMPSIGNYYALGSNLTIYEAMKHQKSIIPAMEEMVKRYDPDLLYAPTFFPIDVMELAGAKNLRWPGAYWDMPLNTPYQYLDESFLKDEDWAEYRKDPTRFLLQRVLPGRYKALEGLSMFNVHALCSQSPLSLAGASIPPIKASLENLIHAAEAAMKSIGDMAEIGMHAIGMGYPIWGDFVPLSPFDEFADCIRGLMPVLKDLRARPAQLHEAVEQWADISIPANIAQGKAMHAQYAMIPLHCGVDSFMSPQQYRQHYWPTLKRMILALIDADITPIVLCEGNYDTRLETIADVPAGKVIYCFETVDMARAKAVLRNTACIAGGMPTPLLIYGSPTEVADETKRLIDICADGGGYIMSNSMSLDNADAALLDIWFETTRSYGGYSGSTNTP